MERNLSFVSLFWGVNIFRIASIFHPSSLLPWFSLTLARFPECSVLVADSLGWLKYTKHKEFNQSVSLILGGLFFFFSGRFSLRILQTLCPHTANSVAWSGRIRRPVCFNSGTNLIDTRDPLLTHTLGLPLTHANSRRAVSASVSPNNNRSCDGRVIKLSDGKADEQNLKGDEEAHNDGLVSSAERMEERSAGGVAEVEMREKNKRWLLN